MPDKVKNGTEPYQPPRSKPVEADKPSGRPTQIVMGDGEDLRSGSASSDRIRQQAADLREREAQREADMTERTAALRKPRPRAVVRPVTG